MKLKKNVNNMIISCKKNHQIVILIFLKILRFREILKNSLLNMKQKIKKKIEKIVKNEMKIK